MKKVEPTKLAISRAYMDLCKEKAPTKISVQEISERAQIKRQTFYYHFQDKQALLKWVYLNNSLKYLVEERVLLDNWEEQVLKMLKAMQEEAIFYQNILKCNRNELMDLFFESIYPIFRQFFLQVDQEKLLSEKDIQFYSRFFSYGCSGILENWLKQGLEESPMTIAMQLFQLAKDVEFFAYNLYQTEE